jgi:hypothetical protein
MADGDEDDGEEPEMEEALVSEMPEGPLPPRIDGADILSGIGRNAATSRTPLFVDLPKQDYDGHEIRMPPHRHKEKPHFVGHRGSTLDIAKAFLAVVVPPLDFLYVFTMLTFSMHFSYPRFVWVFVLIGFVPVFISLMLARGAGAFRHYDSQVAAAGAKWHRLTAILFSFAFVSAAIAGELNYWYFSHVFYYLDSMKTYSNINPAETDGVRLMDAGKVFFSEGSRVATDMGMSYTTWDVYCVAPITTDEGMASQGNSLSTYDLWAVGVNCCRSADTNFHCGAYGDPAARAGLRQISENQRGFFRLAVEQAEAAYNIRSAHPVFFYWTQDPAEQESDFFTDAFANWVMLTSIHFVANLFVVILFFWACNPAQRDVDSLMDLAK